MNAIIEESDAIRNQIDSVVGTLAGETEELVLRLTKALNLIYQAESPARVQQLVEQLGRVTSEFNCSLDEVQDDIDAIKDQFSERP